MACIKACRLLAQDFGMDIELRFFTGIQARRKAFTENHRRKGYQNLHMGSMRKQPPFESSGKNNTAKNS
jgi:hypothetical protein